jgi:hypothetical protein
VHFAVACLGLIAFLIANVYSLVGLQVHKTATIAFFGFGPTEIRTLLILGNLWVLAFGIVDLRPWFHAAALPVPLSIHDLVIGLLALAATGGIAASALVERRALSLAEPPPAPASSPP